MKSSIILFLAVCFLATSCGDNTSYNTRENKPEKKETPAKEETPEEETPAIDPADIPKEVTIELGSDDYMKFDKKEIRVYEGQKVTVNLTHTGKMPESAMGHNFVLLKAGTEMIEFALNAAAAVNNDYIPVDSKDIIAHTEMIGGGESTSVTFDAPAKGTYDFICSFPAHYSLMKGKFIVQ
ncbi:MAG: azurin [Bacteroidota bacterium]